MTRIYLIKAQPATPHASYGLSKMKRNSFQSWFSCSEFQMQALLICQSYSLNPGKVDSHTYFDPFSSFAIFLFSFCSNASCNIGCGRWCWCKRRRRCCCFSNLVSSRLIYFSSLALVFFLLVLFYELIMILLHVRNGHLVSSNVPFYWLRYRLNNHKNAIMRKWKSSV